MLINYKWNIEIEEIIKNNFLNWTLKSDNLLWLINKYNNIFLKKINYNNLNNKKNIYIFLYLAVNYSILLSYLFFNEEYTKYIKYNS